MRDPSSDVSGEHVVLRMDDARLIRRLLVDAHHGVGALGERLACEDRAYASVPRALLTQAIGLIDGGAWGDERRGD